MAPGENEFDTPDLDHGEKGEHFCYFNFSDEL